MNKVWKTAAAQLFKHNGCLFKFTFQIIIKLYTKFLFIIHFRPIVVFR